MDYCICAPSADQWGFTAPENTGIMLRGGDPETSAHPSGCGAGVGTRGAGKPPDRRPKPHPRQAFCLPGPGAFPRFFVRPPDARMLDRSGGRGIIQPNTAKSNPGVRGFDLERKKKGADVLVSPPGGNGRPQISSDGFPGVAQLVARVLWEHQAAGSNPVTRTKT